MGRAGTDGQGAFERRMRVALLNCYLQGGHTENAEVESSARFVEAARRLGIEARIFARSEDLADFQPDFVLSLSYNDAKLAGFPTYLLLTAPPRWFDALPRFRRNVLTYDGYWTVSPSVTRHVAALYAKAGKPDLSAFAALSCARTGFVPLDFARAWAAYVGTNWDGGRHGDLFRALATGGTARFYGKRERWSHLPAEALGGEVPFDGRSVLDIYRKAGIGLCLGHADFDAAGIPTSRTFEIPAASAVMIAARNALIEEAFGDAALYVDAGSAPEAAADAIRGHVEWVRAHPKQALAMAEACHRAFNERFALETMIANAVDMHRRACRALGFAPPGAAGSAAGDGAGFAATVAIAVRDSSLRHFGRCLDSVLRQTLPAQRIVVLDATSRGRASEAVRARRCAPRAVQASGAVSRGLRGAAGARLGRRGRRLGVLHLGRRRALSQPPVRGRRRGTAARRTRRAAGDRLFGHRADLGRARAARTASRPLQRAAQRAHAVGAVRFRGRGSAGRAEPARSRALPAARAGAGRIGRAPPFAAVPAGTRGTAARVGTGWPHSVHRRRHPRHVGRAPPCGRRTVRAAARLSELQPAVGAAA